MGTQDSCSLGSMGGTESAQGAPNAGEMDMEALVKLMMMMMIMKMLEAFMNNMDGGGQGGLTGAM